MDNCGYGTKNRKFNITVTLSNNPPKQPRSKKKRIQGKYRKKYEASIERIDFYKGVEILDISEVYTDYKRY